MARGRIHTLFIIATSTLENSRRPCVVLMKFTQLASSPQPRSFRSGTSLNSPEPWLQFLKTGRSFHSGLNINGGDSRSFNLDSRIVS